jgi:histidinol-phosphatase (PHP family)
LILADLHTHSNNSPDGETSVAELCESAVAKKLSYIGITDHCEIDLYQKDRYEMRLKQSYLDMLRAQDIYDGRIEILKGVELGNALNDRILAEKVAGSLPYDVILGSLHHPVGIDDFAFLDFNKISPKELLDTYYDEIEKMVDWGCFDVLAHLTYPLRYINGNYKCNVDIMDFSEKIKSIFVKLIAKGKALEINTSGLRQPYGLTMPDLWGVRLFHEMGGTMITIGSDAHTAKDIGANIIDGLKLAKEAGFENYCIFKQRKPISIKIDIS